MSIEQKNTEVVDKKPIQKQNISAIQKESFSGVQKNEKISNADTLAYMVQKQFGVSRNVFSEKNRARLAKMAEVTIEEYNDALSKYNGKTDRRNYEYNIKIRQRILDNNIISPTEVQLQGFDDAGELIRFFGEEKVVAYVGNLSLEQKQMWNTLSLPQKIAFFEAESVKIEQRKQIIKKNMSADINDMTIEQIANISELLYMQERLTKFLTQHTELKKYQMTDEKIETYLASMNDVQKKEYQKLVNIYGEEGAKIYLKHAHTLKNIESSEEYKALSIEEKREFEEMMIEFYEVSQKLDIDLATFDLGMIYVRAREYLTVKYGSYEREFTSVVKNVLQADQEPMKSFFDEYTIDAL
jgi:hypothetical protein